MGDLMDINCILAAALPFEEKVSLSMTTLLTGFVVVFSVLLLLIVMIILLGKIVTAAQKKPKKKSETPTVTAPTVTQNTPVTSASDGIPEEIIAVIAAAVDSTFGAGKARITGIKKSRAAGGRSAWGQAGVMNNTRPF